MRYHNRSQAYYSVNLEPLEFLRDEGQSAKVHALRDRLKLGSQTIFNGIALDSLVIVDSLNGNREYVVTSPLRSFAKRKPGGTKDGQSYFSDLGLPFEITESTNVQTMVATHVFDPQAYEHPDVPYAVEIKLLYNAENHMLCGYIKPVYNLAKGAPEPEVSPISSIQASVTVRLYDPTR